MKILEKEPDKYDEEFHKLFPESSSIYEIIRKKVGKVGRILEIGCGTGQLAIQLAEQDLDVVAVDISVEMINHARKSAEKEQVSINFIQGSFIDFQIFDNLKNLGPFDFIVSTFVLSEFSPLQQELFIKQTSQLLKTTGSLLIAAETIPTSLFKRFVYSMKQAINSQIMLLRSSATTTPIRNFEVLLSDYYSCELLYKGLKKSVQFYQCRLKETLDSKRVSFTPINSVLGRVSRIKVAWCILNGLLTRKQVPPGLYKVGTPKQTSPFLVTGNYYWTLHSVYSSLIKQKIDCYLLVIDSAGINVWCAAGGGHFSHSQVIDALRLFNAELVVNHRNLILPQLSATGVDHQKLKDFGWKSKFGPVYIDSIDDFIRDGNKTQNQGKVKFDFSYRTLMGIQHTFFILIVVFLPLCFLTGFLGYLRIIGALFWFNVMIQMTIIGCTVSMLFAWIYPILNPVRSFFKKGILLGGINAVLVFIYVINQGNNIGTVLFWIALVLLVSMFVVLDFAGSTPFTNHLDVESDLVLFSIPALVLAVIALLLPVVSSAINMLL
ncbi:MAG: methyltransferase domain-containing protein [Candidatus Hodarchaeota archaeon]